MDDKGPMELQPGHDPGNDAGIDPGNDAGIVPQVATEPPPPARPSHLQMQFDDADQQRETATLGMWVFLITEIMFFGGLFVAYLVYRNLHFQAFVAGSRSLSYGSGTAMTVVLILSSLTMAMAVHSAESGNTRKLRGYLFLTLLLGASFLVLKGLEYHEHVVRHQFPGASFAFPGPLPLTHHVEMFFVLYWCMTGLHAIHMLVGIGLVIWLIIVARRMTPQFHNSVENIGLYWHFVDIIWIYLYPLLYLIDRWR